MIIVKKKICIFSTLFMSMFFLTENVFARSFQCDALEGVVFDEQVPHIIKYVLLIIQILVPIFLVIFGSIDLFKGVYAQKEDEIKKGQQTFIKRLIAGVLVFFVYAIVKLLISAVAGDENVMQCACYFINGTNDSSCSN